MSEHVKTPWQFSNRNWRNEVDESGNLYITGDHHESSIDTGEDGEYVEGGPYCTSVAIVCGNATAGNIPTATAEFICRAANVHDELLSACKAMLDTFTDEIAMCDNFPEVVKARAAIEKAGAK